MKSRLLVAAVGIPLILYAILWAPLAILKIILALLSAIGCLELMKCVNAHSNWQWGAALAAGLTVLFPAFGGETLVLPLLMLYSVLFFAFAVFKGGEIKWQEIATAFFAIIVFPYAFTAFLRLFDHGYHRSFLLLPLIFSFASDTGAFFAGLAFGKHKLAPKVSPKKTVEGAIGGLVGNAVGGIVFAWIMNSFMEQNINYFMIALLGVICSVVAQLGDLSFSLIKREFGIKDYGTLFLAHGGVLDRFDSVIFVAPVLSALMIAFL